jgi:uncharacterized protein (DUF2164 family)
MEDFYAKMAHRLKQVREMEMEGVEQEFPVKFLSFRLGHVFFNFFLNFLFHFIRIPWSELWLK